MPSKVQSFPVGLQDILGTKSLGKNPDELSDAVLSTFDLTEFYLANRQEQIAGFLSTQSLAGEQVTINMPLNGQLFLMKEMAAVASVPSAIGTVMNIGLNYVPAGGTRQPLAQSVRHVSTSNNASEQTSAMIHWEQPRIFLPGTGFNGRLTENCGGATTCRVNIRIVFYRVLI